MRRIGRDWRGGDAAQIAMIARLPRCRKVVVSTRICGCCRSAVTDDRKGIDRVARVSRRNTPQSRVEGEHQTRGRPQSLSDTRSHKSLALRAQPIMDIDAAIADKFPKTRLSPCVLAADPLSLTGHPRGFFTNSMRLSRYFLPILRETPKEAEIVSHRLMLRAGM